PSRRTFRDRRSRRLRVLHGHTTRSRPRAPRLPKRCSRRPHPHRRAGRSHLRSYRAARRRRTACPPPLNRRRRAPMKKRLPLQLRSCAFLSSPWITLRREAWRVALSRSKLTLVSGAAGEETVPVYATRETGWRIAALTSHPALRLFSWVLEHWARGLAFCQSEACN